MQFREKFILRDSSFGSNETEGSIIPPLISFVILVLFPLQNKQTQEVNIFIFYYCSFCDSLAHLVDDLRSFTTATTTSFLKLEAR